MEKDYKTAIGMMSGTSMDGIDAVLVRICLSSSQSKICSDFSSPSGCHSDTSSYCHCEFPFRCHSELVSESPALAGLGPTPSGIPKQVRNDSGLDDSGFENEEGLKNDCSENHFGFEVIDSHTLDYPDEIRAKLLEIANNKGTTKDICFMDFVVAKLFAQCANELVEKSGLTNQDIDYIASHGQTVFHIPQELEIGGVKTGSTLQIGNISVIAELTGIETIGDFRSRDIAAGGQGAPLVPFADEIIFKKDISRAIQNIGGIGNVTVLSNDCDTFAFDTGPGNMLIDFFMQKLFNKSFDKDGETASKGKVDEVWLEKLLNEPYYSLQPPKSTGRELFNEEYAQKIFETAPNNNYDVIATVTALTAKTIANAYKDFVMPKTVIKEVVIGGGGAYNTVLLKFLQKYLGPETEIKTHEDFGINDKHKEAIAFAILGFCTINKIPNNVLTCTGAKKRVIMGINACS